MASSKKKRARKKAAKERAGEAAARVGGGGSAAPREDPLAPRFTREWITLPGGERRLQDFVTLAAHQLWTWATAPVPGPKASVGPQASPSSAQISELKPLRATPKNHFEEFTLTNDLGQPVDIVAAHVAVMPDVGPTEWEPRDLQPPNLPPGGLAVDPGCPVAWHVVGWRLKLRVGLRVVEREWSVSDPAEHSIYSVHAHVQPAAGSPQIRAEVIIVGPAGMQPPIWV
jgi:hypothetical protein